MTTDFKTKLNQGQLLIGPMVTLSSPDVVEILCMSDFDWLFLDAEHGSMATLDMQRLLQVANLPCVVRVAAAGEVPIKKALDIGAAGVIVPQVNTADQAEAVVKWAKYAPEGHRGVGLGRAHGYGLRFQDYVDTANETTAVIVQAEHIEAVENIDTIVQTPGIDAVLIGPYDLSASMDLMGQVEHPDVRKAIDRVTQVCQKAGIPLGIFGVSAAAVQPYIEQGYTLIVAGVDAILLGQAAEALLAKLKK